MRIVTKSELLYGSIAGVNLTFSALVKDSEFNRLHSYNQMMLKLLEKLEATAMIENADMARLAVKGKGSVPCLTKGKLKGEFKKLNLQVINQFQKKKTTSCKK